MTVQELIDELLQFPKDKEVKFAYNYGDYWKTEVAADIDRVDLKLTKYSSYHNMDKVVDDEEEETDEIHECVILC